MRTRFLNQPFGPDGQPQTLGEILTTEILSNAYASVEIWVAYATSSGTSRVFGALRDLIGRGGTATVHIGLSNGVTSVQAVEHLLFAGASVFGFETGGTVLFHPKVYVLRGDARIWVSIGSSNLTGDGLYRNFEANSITTCEARNQADQTAIQELLDTLGNLRAMQGVSRQIRTADTAPLVASSS